MGQNSKVPLEIDANKEKRKKIANRKKPKRRQTVEVLCTSSVIQQLLHLPRSKVNDQRRYFVLKKKECATSVRNVFGIVAFFRNPHCKHRGKVVDYQVIISAIFLLSLNTVFCTKAKKNLKPSTFTSPTPKTRKITCILQKCQKHSCLHLLKKKENTLKSWLKVFSPT